MGQKTIRGRAFPLRIAWREMLPDIACADRAKNGVGQGVKPHIGVRMAFEPDGMRYLHPAEPDMIAIAEAVNIEARSGSRFPAPHQHPFRPFDIRPRRDLEIVLIALDQRHGYSGCRRDSDIVGKVATRRCPVGFQDRGETEGLRRLRAPEPVARHGLAGKPLRGAAHRVRYR